MTETLLKKKVLAYLKTIPNLWVYKSSDRFTSGIPDLLLCNNGYFMAIELKVKPNKTTRLQDYVLNQINKAKGKTAVCYSLEEVQEFLEKERESVKNSL